MYWQQALKTSHAASIPSWVHWPQAPLTLLIALIVSWVSLRYRYLDKGRPFGSIGAAVRAVTVIVLTALLSTVLGVLLPRLPVTIGAFIPALLCTDRLDRLGKAEGGLNAVENPPWFGIITLGISLLLKWLEIQMAEDCERWCKLKMSEVHDLNEIEQAAEGLHGALTRACTNTHLKQKLQSDYDAICSAVSRTRDAEDHGQHEEARKQSFAAKQALMVMLGRAYKSGYTSTAVMPRSPDQRSERQRRDVTGQGVADLSSGFRPGGSQAWPPKRPRRASILVIPHFAGGGQV